MLKQDSVTGVQLSVGLVPERDARRRHRRAPRRRCDDGSPKRGDERRYELNFKKQHGTIPSLERDYSPLRYNGWVAALSREPEDWGFFQGSIWKRAGIAAARSDNEPVRDTSTENEQHCSLEQPMNPDSGMQE